MRGPVTMFLFSFYGGWTIRGGEGLSLKRFRIKGFFSDFKKYFVQQCFISRPLDYTVSEDAGIEPRIVATFAVKVRCSTHLARSDPQTRQDL
jgi:hypothetical protein